MPFKRLPGDDGGKSSGWVRGRPRRRFGDYLAPAPERSPRPPELSLHRHRSERRRAREGRARALEGGAADQLSRRRPASRQACAQAAARTTPIPRRPGSSRSSTPAAPPPARSRASAARSRPRPRRPDPPRVAARHRPQGRQPHRDRRRHARRRALGLEPGMALTQARASVPDLDVRDADPEGDRADLRTRSRSRSRAAGARWSRSRTPTGCSSTLTGVAHLHGGEAAMAARIVRLLARFGVTARVAVADTAGAAWAAARR